MESSHLLSPSIPFDAGSSEDVPSQFTFGSPCSSPLMLSPIASKQSPQIYFSPLPHTQAHRTHSLQAITPVSYLAATTDNFSPGPRSTSSSDDSQSPADNSLDTDFENMQDFDFSPHMALGGGYNHGAQTLANRKPHPIQIPRSHGGGIAIASPYQVGSAELPFISGHGHMKQEYFSQSLPDAGSYSYMDTPSQVSHAQSFTYSPSPESAFLDNTAYYSPTGPISAHPSSIPMSAHPHHAYSMLHGGGGHSSSPVAAGGQGGCDPRFVSGSPPDLDLRSRTMPGAGAAVAYHTARFAGAFGSADSEFDDDFKFDADSGEEEKPSDGYDSDFVLRKNMGHLRSQSSLVVPSQADRMSALTTPTVGSSVMPPQVLTSSTTSLRSRTDARTLRPSRPSAPVPIPIPNLTKKSRGRRVPTHPGVVLNTDGTPVKRSRGYMCRVAECGKCFARGEHLKRHVRSIHTHEKRESQ